MLKIDLSIIIDIEKDFVSNNAQYNSYLDLAASQFAVKEYDKAVQLYEKAIELDSKNAGAWIGCAIANLEKTKFQEIGSLQIDNFLSRAKNNTDAATYAKYIDPITLYCANQNVLAINFFIDASNRAIAEKKVAEIAATIGMVAAIAGGVVAKNSKSLTGTLVGYSMLTGGAGYSIKKGFASFDLDKLAKSTYGNALAQLILSVPIIQQCDTLHISATDTKKQSIEQILEDWKKAVIYLYNNEKRGLLANLELFKDEKNIVNKAFTDDVSEKTDRMIYLMDMVGLDNAVDFKHFVNIKNDINDLIKNFSPQTASSFENKNLVTGCLVAPILYFLAFIIPAIIVSPIYEAIYGKEVSNFSESQRGYWIYTFLVFWLISSASVYMWTKKRGKKISDDLGISDVQSKATSIITQFQSINIEPNEIDLKLLGIQ
jgi:tetratricopeptide (TPR) repeat protein